MSERACKICKRLTEDKECIVCKSEDLTRNWKGVIIVYDPESEVAKKAGLSVPGRYAMQIF